MRVPATAPPGDSPDDLRVPHSVRKSISSWCDCHNLALANVSPRLLGFLVSLGDRIARHRPPPHALTSSLGVGAQDAPHQKKKKKKKKDARPRSRPRLPLGHLRLSPQSAAPGARTLIHTPNIRARSKTHTEADIPYTKYAQLRRTTSGGTRAQ